MDYELVKELKKAGFPVEMNTAKWHLQVPWGKGVNGITPKNEHYGYMPPTLSELIEACGDNFETLLSAYFNGAGKADKKLWQATCRTSGYKTISSRGTTPEEAVARLWLALNKK